ncbi:alpha/beta hydrolase fold domain-containing protein [Cryobacterium sp. PH31-L1]|nr:alpha/beta hydrolase fold domain-containing protein [Cryobacterium sp. PH31-L1]MDJ0376266.1 alpha/beta hydrolase fold domain-containing protein [Cryobacterium sp. PH31-L1]
MTQRRRDKQRNNATVSPLYADLSGLPPTLIATADHDLLRSEGTMLGTRIREYGVNVNHVEYAGIVHGLLGLGHVSPTAEAGQDLFERFYRLRRYLS